MDLVDFNANVNADQEQRSHVADFALVVSPFHQLRHVCRKAVDTPPMTMLRTPPLSKFRDEIAGVMPQRAAAQDELRFTVLLADRQLFGIQSDAVNGSAGSIAAMTSRQDRKV